MRQKPIKAVKSLTDAEMHKLQKQVALLLNDQILVEVLTQIYDHFTMDEDAKAGYEREPSPTLRKGSLSPSGFTQRTVQLSAQASHWADQENEAREKKNAGLPMRSIPEFQVAESSTWGKDFLDWRRKRIKIAARVADEVFGARSAEFLQWVGLEWLFACTPDPRQKRPIDQWLPSWPPRTRQDSLNRYRDLDALLKRHDPNGQMNRLWSQRLRRFCEEVHQQWHTPRHKTPQNQEPVWESILDHVLLLLTPRQSKRRKQLGIRWNPSDEGITLSDPLSPSDQTLLDAFMEERAHGRWLSEEDTPTAWSRFLEAQHEFFSPSS